MTDESKEPKDDNVESIINPDEFRVPATDSSGHQRRVQFHTQPGHVNQAEMLVALKIFPYRTKGDLYRHGVARHIKYLEWLARKLKKPIPSVTAATDAIIAVMRQVEFQMELNKLIDKLAGLVAELVSRNAENEAKRLILEIKREIGGMNEGYWRDRYVKDINDRFGYLLDKVERASLLKLATGEE